jgi:hypothetical protein
MLQTGELVRLFVGDDWAEYHHDVEVMDASGRVLARKRLHSHQLRAVAGDSAGAEGLKVLALTRKTLI